MNLNFSQNSYLSPPGGFPFRMSPTQDMSASAFMPKYFSSITATVKADSTATVHLALLMPPILPGGDDLAVVAQTDATVSGAKADVVVSVPSSLPTPFQIGTGGLTLTSGSATATFANSVVTPWVTDSRWHPELVPPAFRVDSWDDGSWGGYQLAVAGDVDAKGVQRWYTISAATSLTTLTLTTQAAATVSGPWWIRPPYVNPPGFSVRLWIDLPPNKTADLVSHQPGTAGYSISQNAGIPQGITVYLVRAS